MKLQPVDGGGGSEVRILIIYKSQKLSYKSTGQTIEQGRKLGPES